MSDEPEPAHSPYPLLLELHRLERHLQEFGDDGNLPLVSRQAREIQLPEESGEGGNDR